MIRHVRLLSTALTMSAMITAGCSVLGTVRGIVPECSEGQWSQIEEERRLYGYRCEYACSGTAVRMRLIPLDSSVLVGFPLIPFIPVFEKEPKKLLFDIHIMSKEGNLPDQPPNIKLKESAFGEEYSPIRVVHVETNIGAIKEEEIHHTEFAIYGDGRTATYLYKFDIDRKSIDAFDLIFPTDYMGCSIPKIRYKAKKKFIYRPFYLPSYLQYIGQNLHEDRTSIAQNEYIFEIPDKYFEQEILNSLTEEQKREYEAPEEPHRMTVREDSLEIIRDIDGLIDFLILTKKQPNAKDVL